MGIFVEEDPKKTPEGVKSRIQLHRHIEELSMGKTVLVSEGDYI